MDELILNPIVLEETASTIEQFFSSANEILEEYYRKVRELSDDFYDNDIANNILDKVYSLKESAQKFLEELAIFYPRYFRERAQIIVDRPAYNGSAIVSATSRESERRENGKEEKIKLAFDKIFENTSKELRQRIFFYLMRIRFIEPLAKSSFYDPYGRSKHGVYKDIMAIDVNSPTFHQDLLSLTAQHIFFYLRRKEQIEIMDSYSRELQNNSHINDQKFKKFVENLKSGGGIDFTYYGDKDERYKEAVAFFSQGFKTYIQKMEKDSEINKYFSYTYHRFVEILNGLDSLN